MSNSHSSVFKRFFILAFLMISQSACFPLLLNSGLFTNRSNDADPGPINPPLVKKVGPENYLSGKKFCETYSDFTGKEYGRFVQVPMDYKDPSKGSLSIYAYTMRPFNPAQPSYIFVDGGPGQNTHGLMPEYLSGQINEIRFDQRGLGCSAPETYDIYKQSWIYSSMNTIRDMEMIRQAYNIKQWSVYGVSYGTVPATMYGSVYPNSVISVVVEGVFGRPDQVHDTRFKAGKLNLVLNGLTTKQREAFSKLVNEDTPEASLVIQMGMQSFYRDLGMRSYRDFLQSILSTDGEIRRDVLQKYVSRSVERENRFSLPQQPGAVDENILTIIYCKNLNYRNKQPVGLYYSEVNGFYAQETKSNRYVEACDEVNVAASDEEPVRMENLPVTKPIYYFQGAHDGATMGIGAMNHWKTVTKGESYFMLAVRGGHNPNLERMEDTFGAGSSVLTSAAMAQRKLFGKAIAGAKLTDADLQEVNRNYDSQQPWLLYTDPKASSVELEKNFEGIFKFRF